MTGYAQARSEANGWALRISVKSVNHRFLDVRFRMPEGFDVCLHFSRRALHEKFLEKFFRASLRGDRGAASRVAEGFSFVADGKGKGWIGSVGER